MSEHELKALDMLISGSIDEQTYKNMSNIGKRVIGIEQHDGVNLKGMKGLILYSNKFESLIMWDDTNAHFHAGHADGVGIIGNFTYDERRNHCYYVPHEKYKLLEDES